MRSQPADWDAGAVRLRRLMAACAPDKETDVLYILEGEATFAFGGTMVGRKTTRPERLGTDVTGGETHHVAKR
jgi:hypothetical protein